MSDHASRESASKEPKERMFNEADFLGMFPPFGMLPPGMFPFFGPVLPLWCSLFVFPFLHWQRAMITAWQKALKEPTFAQVSEEELRRRAKLLLGLYLEGHQFRQELGKDVLDWQSDWVEAWLEILKGVAGSVERRTMG